jgi:hypothetical protein
VSEFLEAGYSVNVIEIDKNNPYIDQRRLDGARVITGDAQDPRILSRARIHKAQRLICVCQADGVNAEISVRAGAFLRNRSDKPLICLAHLFSPSLSALLKARTMELDKKNSFSIEFFNIYQTAAWKMLNLMPPFTDEEALSGPTPRLMVIGLGKLGENLVAQAAKRWRDHCSNPNRRMRITIVDPEAKRKTSALCLRYPKLNKIARLGVLDMEVESQQFLSARFLEDPDERSCLRAIFVCLEDQTLAMTAGLNLAARSQGKELSIIVRMASESGLASLIGAADSSNSGKSSLIAFGLLDRTCGVNLEQYYTINIVARALHMDAMENRRQSLACQEDEDILKPWDKLAPELRNRFIDDATALTERLSSAGCLIAPRTNWDSELFQFTHEELNEIGGVENEQCNDDLAPQAEEALPNLNEQTEDQCGSKKAITSFNADEAKSIPRILASVDLEIYRLDELGAISNKRFH